MDKKIFLIIYMCTLFAASNQLHIKSTKATRKFEERHDDKRESDKETLNIGMIAPHTNFGKREYSRAINSAILSLSKLRGGSKTGITNNTLFSSQNVHFDMMPLTPSPTSKKYKYITNFAHSTKYILFKFELRFSHLAHHVPSIFKGECICNYLSDEL